MDIGIFLPVEPEERSPVDEFRSIIDLSRECEDLGFNSIWVASRHFSPEYAAVPSPLVLLAAIAAVTRRICLGTSVVSLPLENPIRLAEDFAVLDSIAGGRARLGVGSGDDKPAFEIFDVDFHARQGLASERLPKLLELLDGAPVDGRMLFPAVAQARSKVALGAQSARGAAWAASLGIGLLQGRSEPNSVTPTASQVRAADAYRQIHAQGRITTARNVWIGSKDEPLLEAAIARNDRYLRSRGRDPLPAGLEAVLQKMHMAVGSADQVVATVIAEVSAIAPDELVLAIDPGGLPAAERLERARLLAKALGL